MRSRPTTMATIAVTAGVALAGCGGSSGPSLSTFKSDYSAQKAQFTTLGKDLASAITSAPKETNSTLATEFQALSTRASAQAANLRKLNVPSKYKAEVSSLATSFDTIGSDLHAVAAAAASGNADAAKSAAEKLVEDAAALKTTDKTLTQQLGLPQSG
jgi:hypothetical protein